MTRHTAAPAAFAYRCGLAFLLAVVAPAAAFAQASITGVVRDTSGAVLPGVTVEATSPVLIEKVRTVVSDGGGQYRIVDLRPGVYSVIFTLPGFNTFKRDGIELTGNFTATVNAELRVGALEETITVTDEAPVIDVQTVSRQAALSSEVIDTIPTGRNYTHLGVLIPGVSAQCAQACSSGPQDVGGSSGDSRSTLLVHGSRFRDQRIAVNGVTISGSTGGLTMTGPNMEAMQEVQLETQSADASTSTGGVRINVVPKDGGNIFSGSLYATGTSEDLQGDNVTQELISRGLSEQGVSRIKRVYDVAATFGGPIARDRVWFFTSVRRMNNATYVGNLYHNKNAGDPTRWTYEPDLSRQVVHDSPVTPTGIRLTWQATARHKIAASLDLRERCDCPNTAGANTSPEAAVDFIFRPDNIQMVQWSSPLTNRMLMEATAVVLPLGWGNRINEGITPGLIRVVEQNPLPGHPSNYRGGAAHFTRHHDLSPRIGAAYDVFGTGKTAVKFSLNRYVADESLGSGTNTIVGAPHVYYQYTASRAWTDGNRNFIPDCDLANPALQDNRAGGGDLCGAFVGANANFGRTIAGTVDDPEVDNGWGTRGFNWLTSVSVQQEIVPQRVAIDVGYFRRWYGNSLATDNRALAASDYTAFSVTVPTDPRLPTSGQTMSGFLNINPNVARLPSDNYVRLAKHFGDQYEYWHGVDFVFSARLGGGTLVQGGTSTGRTVADNCEVLQNVPETGVSSQNGLSSAILAINGPLATPFCHQQTPFLTQVKLLGTYTVPRIDVQLAATFQSIPGPMINADLVVPNRVVEPTLGRPLAGNAANITVPIVAPGSLYGDRLNQTDFRVGKIIRLPGNRRVTASVDLYNLFNSSAVLAERSNYSSFRTPTRVVGARLVKFTTVLNF